MNSKANLRLPPLNKPNQRNTKKIKSAIDRGDSLLQTRRLSINHDENILSQNRRGEAQLVGH